MVAYLCYGNLTDSEIETIIREVGEFQNLIDCVSAVWPRPYFRRRLRQPTASKPIPTSATDAGSGTVVSLKAMLSTSNA